MKGRREEKEHVRLSRAFSFEDRVPAKLGRTPRGDDAAVCASLEENGLGAGPRAERKRAECPGVRGIEAREQPIQTWARARMYYLFIFHLFIFSANGTERRPPEISTGG